MPVHDWTRVEAGIFHAFHTAWISAIQARFNDGLLPKGYYALAEQHMGQSVADVLTLHGGDPALEPASASPGSGGTAVAESPPKVRRRHSVEPAALNRRRTLAIRHVTGHRLVAILEIVSPANKDRPRNIEVFAAKAVDALDHAVSVMAVDLFPPGPNDPHGIHHEILRRLDLCDEPYDLPADEPLTLASYAAGPRVEIYLEHLAVGATVPDMPLFLSSQRYINAPLEASYGSAYDGMPAFWRDVLEGRQ